MNLKITNTSKLLISIVISWIILAIIFGIYDLEISIAFVDEDSLWGNFGADYGETPGWALIFIAFSILIGSRFKDVKKQKIGGVAMILFGIVYFMYYLLEGSQKRATDGVGMIIGVFLFTILTFNRDWKEYRLIAVVIALLAVFNVLLFVQITKFLCGRIRFRNLASDYSNFTPWFAPPGPTGSQSFPSGHASMGFMLLPLLILVKERELKDPKRIIFSIIIIGWGLFVAMSRVAVGAHFASDVLFSSAAAMVITILLHEKVYLKKKE